MVKKPITVKLAKADIEVLKDLGGNTKGIETLIEDYTKNKPTPGEINPEEAFFNSIHLPTDKSMKATYISYLNAFIRKGVRAEAIGYSISNIMGTTGFDDATVRKHFRKLVSVGFIKSAPGSMFRPTLRLCSGVAPEVFAETLEDYTAFICGTEDYTDFWGDDL